MEGPHCYWSTMFCAQRDSRRHTSRARSQGRYRVSGSIRLSRWCSSRFYQ